MPWLTPELNGVIVGGLLSIFGSALLAWINGRSVRKQRFDQLVAEKRLSTLEEAHFLAKIFEGMINSPDLPAKLAEHEPWMFRHRPYLPVAFCEKWLALRRDHGLLTLAREHPGQLDQIGGMATVYKLEETNRKTVSGMIEDIHRELRMKAMKVPPAPRRATGGKT